MSETALQHGNENKKVENRKTKNLKKTDKLRIIIGIDVGRYCHIRDDKTVRLGFKPNSGVLQ